MNVDDGYESGYESAGGTRYGIKKQAPLGRGSYSRARLLESLEGTKSKVVLDPKNPSHINQHELNAKHYFFLTLYPDLEVKLFKKAGSYRMVVPLVPGKAYKQLQFEDKEQKIKLFISAIKALKNCHSKKLIVIDLKEDNIFFDEKSGESYLIDGGLSVQEGDLVNPRIFRKDDFFKVLDARIEFSYIAPECWSTEEVPACYSMDIFALGATMERILKVQDKELLQLIAACKGQNPKTRLTLDELEQQLNQLLTQQKVMDAPVQEKNSYTSVDIKDVNLQTNSQILLNQKIAYNHVQKEELMQQLKAINEKAIELESKGCIDAARTAFKLHKTLNTASEKYFNSQLSKPDLMRICNKAIAKARPELEKFRGWRLLLANLGIAIAGLGIGFVVAGLINQAVTGNFLFFRTESAKQLDELEIRLNRMGI